MKNRIIKTEDGFIFVNVTDVALALFATNSVELFELNDELTESLIDSEERLKEALELGNVVVMEVSDYLLPDVKELRVWTFFDGTEGDVDDFIREWETLLGTNVTADFIPPDSEGGDSWYCEAFVNQEQIDEFNMDEDWFTIQ